MAKYQAIAATGQAILGILAESYPKDEFGVTRFDLYQAENFRTRTDDCISLYLYRVALNASQRGLNQGIGPGGKRLRPPMPVDLHYVLTPWAKTAAKQQRMLGWAIRALENSSVLPASLLNSYSPEPEIFKPGETVELIFETPALQDLSNLWGVAKTDPMLSAYYIARVINIESLSDVAEAEPVQTRVFNMAGENNR